MNIEYNKNKIEFLKKSIGIEKLKEALKNKNELNNEIRSNLDSGVIKVEEFESNLDTFVTNIDNSINKIERNDLDLSIEEIGSLEAIVLLLDRPAINIFDNDFSSSIPTPWSILNNHRDKIKSNILSVGRINIQTHPNNDWIGTGFLVSDDVIMTNEHTAIVFSRPDSNGIWRIRWPISIDFGQDLSGNHNEFEIDEVIGMHSEVDMALLRISSNQNNAGNLPQPLKFVKNVPDIIQERNIYVVGFPAFDPERNDPIEMNRIFNNLYGFKRLQPGKIKTLMSNSKIFIHDCSTLGGNSGSPIFDLETHNVIGLHFAGRYLIENKGIAMWNFSDDILLSKAGIEFI